MNTIIASLDREIFRLFIERFDNAIELGRIKRALQEDTQDKKREAGVLANVAAIKCHFLSQSHRRSIYFEIMDAARKLEEVETNEQIPNRNTPQAKRTLLQAKQQHRTRIDKLDSEIVRLLDQRMELTNLSLVAKPTAIQWTQAEEIRVAICDLQVNSDMKQIIWKIYCCALRLPETLVASPIGLSSRPIIEGLRSRPAITM